MNGIVFSVEHANVDPDARRNVGGIDAKLPEELGRLRKDPDTLLSLWHASGTPTRASGACADPRDAAPSKSKKHQLQFLSGCREIASR